MSAVCPNGHTSSADDYCDTCGSPIDAAAQSPAGAPASKSSLDLDPPPSAAPADPPAAPAPTTLSCPNCSTENAPAALFCEACGYDFTTGAMPRDADDVESSEGAAHSEGAEAAGGADPAEAAAADPEPADGSDPPGDPDPAAGSVSAASGSPVIDPSPSSDPYIVGPESASAIPAAGPAGEDPASAASSFEWLAEVWIDPDWYQTQEADDPCPSPGLPAIMPLRYKSVLLGRVSSSKNTNPEIDLSSDPGVSRRHAQLTTDGTRWFVEDLGSSNGTFVGPAAGPLPTTGIKVGPRSELDDDDRLYVGAWTRVVVRRATPDEVEAFA